MITTQSQKNPSLRFPEFEEEWKAYRLSDFLTKYSENNKDEEFSIDDILSLSSHYGIVNRKELLEDTYANVNHLNYKKTRLNDFIYGKSISASYPFGLFKVNDCKDGLLSTLYFTFKVGENVYPKFLDCYFSYSNRANSFLSKYVLVGDRYITADADYLLSGQINLPTITEQQKIVSFLRLVDESIINLKRQKDALGEYKRGVVQKIFSQEIRFKDDNEKDYSDWMEKKLGYYMKLSPKRNKDKKIDLVLSVSNRKGFIAQTEQFEDHRVASKDVSNYKIVERGDFAYNPSRINVGSIACLKYFSTGIVSPMYVVFKLSDELSPEFLESYISTHHFKYLVRAWCSGSVRDSLNFDDLERFKVKFPSLAEQQKIADFLTSLDKVIEKKQQRIALAEEWKKGLMQKLFI